MVGPVESMPANSRAVDFVVEADRAQLTEIAARVRDGRLRTNIGTIAALEEAIASFTNAERPQGKTIITVHG